MAKGKFERWLIPEKLILLEAWARDGLTDEQIAHNMGIRRSTLAEWKNKYSDISDALKKGKEVVDVEVENALLKRALGYDYTEEKVEIEKGAHGTVLNHKVTQTMKHIPPDVGAATFWLKNRKPNAWRDKQPENQNVMETEDDPITKSLKKEFSK